jgi:hypothetical protein
LNEGLPSFVPTFDRIEHEPLHDPTGSEGFLFPTRPGSASGVSTFGSMPSDIARRIRPLTFEQGATQEGFHGHDLQGNATEPTGMEDYNEPMRAADSGYHSGTRYSCTNFGDGNPIDNDTDSVATDGWPSSLPKQDKYMLEAEFAREMFNRSSAKTRGQFAERAEMVMDLLYSFSVMIGGRASSAAERGAASFVRRGRKYVSPNPDSHLRDCPHAHVLTLQAHTKACARGAGI